MARILLSAMGGPVAPSIIRKFQENGHSVLGTDLSNDAVGRFFCDDFLIAPRGDDVEAYLGFMESIVDRFDVFFPFLDEELRTLAQAADRAAPILVKTYTSPPETLLLCTHKGDFQDACVTRGLPIAPRASQPPAVTKPVHGRGGRGVRVVEDAGVLKNLSKDPALVCQKQIRGCEYTVDVLTDAAGKWVFGVARKRLQARGVSIEGQVDMNEKVLDLARRVVATFSFSGPINIQVIVEEDSGDVYLIEVNPRLAGSLIFSVLAGFDILEGAVTQFLGGTFTPPAKINDGIKISRYWSEQIV